MTEARLRWPPYPYRAGFTMTDDTDDADLERVRIVYRALAEAGIRITKTVWVAPPEERCGIPPLPDRILEGITLEDPDYLRWCEQLGTQGFEIALHDPTAGNNRRALYERAFALLDRHFPPAHTHIAHARNADHLYWQEGVVARGPLRWLLDRVARRHQSSGHEPASPYFWGDLCQQRIRYMRLFRTRALDTLSVNPSMPYFEREKPFVRGWFSATKRSFTAATSETALAALVRDWGLCMLYQYVCRWGDPATGRPLPAFAAGVARLAAARAVWTEPASVLLDRLRHIQGVFMAARGATLHVLNTDSERLDHIQIETHARPSCAHDRARWIDGVLVIDSLEAGESLALALDRTVQVTGRQSVHHDDPQSAGLHHDFGHGTLEWDVTSGRWRLAFAPGLETLRPRSRASDAELTRLFLGQAAIVAREVLLGRRHPDLDRFLMQPDLKLGTHDDWE